MRSGCGPTLSTGTTGKRCTAFGTMESSTPATVMSATRLSVASCWEVMPLTLLSLRLGTHGVPGRPRSPMACTPQTYTARAVRK
uniref:Uncharacterized protein n=1 Tax=uncultured marine virus TaxID=186617 RepID=A0A0F7L7D7_9VIRU|nr:hypothetical protein [uncultured marine virus]